MVMHTQACSRPPPQRQPLPLGKMRRPGTRASAAWTGAVAHVTDSSSIGAWTPPLSSNHTERPAMRGTPAAAAEPGPFPVRGWAGIQAIAEALAGAHGEPSVPKGPSLIADARLLWHLALAASATAAALGGGTSRTGGTHETPAADLRRALAGKARTLGALHPRTQLARVLAAALARALDPGDTPAGAHEQQPPAGLHGCAHGDERLQPPAVQGPSHDAVLARTGPAWGDI